MTYTQGNLYVKLSLQTRFTAIAELGTKLSNELSKKSQFQFRDLFLLSI